MKGEKPKGHICCPDCYTSKDRWSDKTCLDTSCSCHTPPPHREESWCEEFEEKWTPPQDWIDNAEYLKRLKSFISQKLKEAREEAQSSLGHLYTEDRMDAEIEEARARGMKEGKATAIEEVVKRLRDARGIATGGKKHNRSWNEGANAVLREAIKASTALKDITRVV